jgi:circadian clock protein KaiB
MISVIEKETKKKTSWRFCLYVNDQTPKSLRAFSNLKKFCEEQFPGKYVIEVIDVTANPEAARTGNVVALPTLVRTFPRPMRMVIGDLTDTQRTIKGLDLRLSA